MVAPKEAVFFVFACFCAVSADTGPSVHFQWMLWFGLPFRSFVDFSITSVAELLQRNRAFIAEDHIVECISNDYNSLCVLQPLCLVCFAYYLAVSGVLKSPASFLAGSTNCGSMDCETTLLKPFLDLAAGRLIIRLHLFFNKSSCCFIQLSWPT